MKAYRIITEDINRDAVIDLASTRFESFSAYTGLGYWQGRAEPMLTIEVIDVDNTINPDTINGLAIAIKVRNNQETVLVTVSDIGAELIR